MRSLPTWLRRFTTLLTVIVAGGCMNGSPDAVQAPEVDPADAVSAALEMYDQNGDKALAGEELARVPGIRMFLQEYDSNGDKQVSQEELTSRFERLFDPMGFAKLSCTVLYNNRPLPDAEVVFEPEPFMGEEFNSASGTTTRTGFAKIAIPDDQLPEANRRLGGGLYNGLYKISITHPKTKIPDAYQGDDTVVGYEVSGLTTRGTQAVLRIDSKGTPPQ